MSEEVYVSGEHKIEIGRRLTSDMSPEYVKDAREYESPVNSVERSIEREKRLIEFERLILPRRREEHREHLLTCFLKVIVAVALILLLMTGAKALSYMAVSLESMSWELEDIAGMMSQESAVDLGGVRSDLKEINNTLQGMSGVDETANEEADKGPAKKKGDAAPGEHDDKTPAGGSVSEDTVSGDSVSSDGVWMDVKDDGRGWIGVTVTDGKAEAADDVIYGALVIEVIDGSPAEKAGITDKDMILAVDDTEVAGKDDFIKCLKDKKPGDKVIVVTLTNGAFSPEEHTVTLVSLKELQEEGQE